MNKIVTLLLTISLGLFSVITLITSILWFLPIDLPFGMYSVLNLVYYFLLKRIYWLLFLGFLICVLFFLAAVSIRKRRILLPMLSLMYLVFEFIVMLCLMLGRLKYGYWMRYIKNIVPIMVTIVLLCIYCWSYWREKRKKS